MGNVITVSLKQILAKSPCPSGWAKVLYGQGKITAEQLAECLEKKIVYLLATQNWLVIHNSQ